LEVRGRPAEFTITPMQNISLGTIKSRRVGHVVLDASQLAVYYACYLQLMRTTARNALKDSSGNPLKRAILATALSLGSWRLLGLIENMCKRRGVDLEKVKRHGLEQRESIRLNAS